MVNLGADLAAALPYLREQANSRMTEVFQFFTRVITTDPSTLEDVSVEDVVLTTPGRLKVSQTMGRDIEAGNQYPVLERLEVHIPSTASAPLAPSPWLLPGDIIPAPVINIGVMVRVIDSSADVSLIGREFRVTKRPSAGQTTAHRYAVEEIV